MTKDQARDLQRDFIPGGREISIKSLKFRKTTEFEVLQCCATVAYDPQSGHIFCGKVSEYVAEIGEEGVVALCERHKPPKHLIVEQLIVELSSQTIVLEVPPSS